MNMVERFRVGKWAGLASGRLTPKASVFAADSTGSVGGTIKGGGAHTRKQNLKDIFFLFFITKTAKSQLE